MFAQGGDPAHRHPQILRVMWGGHLHSHLRVAYLPADVGLSLSTCKLNLHLQDRCEVDLSCRVHPSDFRGDPPLLITLQHGIKVKTRVAGCHHLARHVRHLVELAGRGWYAGFGPDVSLPVNKTRSC